MTLTSAVSTGTGIMIGGGIFALIGQVAGLPGEWFHLAFLAAAAVTDEIKASAAVLISAIFLDAVILGALLIIKASTDALISYTTIIGTMIIFVGDSVYLK